MDFIEAQPGWVAVFKKNLDGEEYATATVVFWQQIVTDMPRMRGIVNGPTGLMPAEADVTFIGYAEPGEKLQEFLVRHKVWWCTLNNIRHLPKTAESGVNFSLDSCDWDTK